MQLQAAAQSLTSGKCMLACGPAFLPVALARHHWLQVKLLLGGAVGGLHTMVDEHFGISIVQYMAAGATVAVTSAVLPCRGVAKQFLAPENAGGKHGAAAAVNVQTTWFIEMLPWIRCDLGDSGRLRLCRCGADRQ